MYTSINNQNLFTRNNPIVFIVEDKNKQPSIFELFSLTTENYVSLKIVNLTDYTNIIPKNIIIL